MHLLHIFDTQAWLVNRQMGAYIRLTFVQRTRDSRAKHWRRTRRRFEMTTITMSRETVRNPGMKPGLMGYVKAYLARSHAERQLRQLDDRLLADIGLKRTDISKSVWGQ